MSLTKSKAFKKKNQPSVISLFTCGMGMDLGFEKAGFETRYANDIAKFACDTIMENKPEVPCDEGDITEISSRTILRKAGLEKGEVDVVIGGPPCQSFSTAGGRKGFEDKRGIALLEFIRVVKETRPRFFVFENVPGLTSMAKKQMSFYERIAKDRKKLSKNQKPGSLYKDILKEFKKIRGYRFKDEILNAADFGVAQKRKRLIIIGSRVADPEIIFKKILESAKWTDPNKQNGSSKRPWRTLDWAIKSIKDAHKEHTQFPTWGKYMKHVPPGGCWVNIPKKYQKRAMGGAANTKDPLRKGKQGGRTGFYRRLSWDLPAPTLVTSPSQLATCICHPDEDRPLTVLEYAKIQGFGTRWKFMGSTSQKYRMIGEAVPVDLAKAIAKNIKKFL